MAGRSFTPTGCSGCPHFPPFDSAGIAAADLTNPQSLNLYAYVNNNPMNAVDRLGLAPCAFYLFDPDPQDGGPPPCVGGGGDGEGPDCAYDNDPLDGCIFVPIPWGGSGRGGGGGGTGPVKPPATEPNVNPSGKPPLSGETLGIPNTVRIPIPSILQTLGLAPNDPACNFIPCGTGNNFQGTATVGAVAGTIVCELAEPCGLVEDAILAAILLSAARDIRQPKLEPDCDKEWRDAAEYCSQLDDIPRNSPEWKKVKRIFGKDIASCMRGQVSQACGGNKVY